jgi:hypothetical protein
MTPFLGFIGGLVRDPVLPQSDWTCREAISPERLLRTAINHSAAHHRQRRADVLDLRAAGTIM